MEQKATTVDKQKFYSWITDALYPHKVMTAYEVSGLMNAQRSGSQHTRWHRKQVEA